MCIDKYCIAYKKLRKDDVIVCKIGIITFHRAHNFGAKLQAYALQYKLNKIIDTEIIDYRCDKIERQYYESNKDFFSKLKKLAKWIVKFKVMRGRRKKKKNFELFDKQYLSLSKEVYISQNIFDANSVYDRIITGSDQVWNLKLSGWDWNYLLEFAEIGKKFSYAASFGGQVYCGEDAVRLKNNLNQFEALFVREKYAAELIKTLYIDKEVKVTIDPVFLLNKQEWISNMQITKQKQDPYILVYIMAPSKKAVDFALERGNKNGKKVVFLNHNGLIHYPDEMINIDDAGPREFLELIYNADEIVTTSFHAMAFALIMNIPFIYELNDNKENDNSRLENLVDIFDVSDRNIKYIMKNGTNDINWDRVNDEIEKQAIISFDNLVSAIIKENSD